MTPEKRFTNNVIAGLKGLAICQRHEDMYSTGIPDISYDIEGMKGSGWIEMKAIPDWPKKENTIVRLEHFTKQQRAWIIKHGSKNARTFIFLRVANDYLIFDWTAATLIGNTVKELLYEACVRSWNHRINYIELVEVLRGRYESSKRYQKQGRNGSL